MPDKLERKEDNWDSDFIVDEKVKEFQLGESSKPGHIYNQGKEIVGELLISEFPDLDDKFIQLTKDTKSKIDEAKAKLDGHIRFDHNENDIYKFLLQTKRGRFMCRLLGYKTKRLNDKLVLKKLEKVKRKARKIRGL